MTDTAQKFVTMSEREVSELVEKTVSVTLTSLGIDHSDPLEMQKDMQYIRSSRKVSDAIKNKAWLTLIGLAVVGMVTITIQGLKEYFKS